MAVKVSPDTTQFRGELKRQLEALEKQLKGHKIDVDLDANTKGVKEKVAKDTKGMKAQVAVTADTNVDAMRKKLGEVNLAFERNMRNALGRVVTPETVGDMKKKLGEVNLSFERNMRSALGRVVTPELVGDMKKKLSEVAPSWDKQVEAFRKELRQSRVDLQPEVLKNKSEVVNLRAEFDYDKSEFELALKRAQAATDGVTVAMKPDLKIWQFQVAKERIKAMFRRDPVTVDVKPDVKAGGGIGSKLLSNLMPSFGSGINFGAYALIFAGILDVAAPLIGLLSAALLSLPGLIGLVAAPIAAVTLGLDGFKKAAEKIKPEFDELRKKMSDVAESQFTPVLERVANTVFPMLERSLPSVTEGLRNLADGALDAIDNPDNKLEQTIQNIGAALTAAKPGVDGFVSGFLQLANALSEKFPAIVDWFNQAGTAFNNWVTQASADGTLSNAFGGLGDSLKIILDTVTELGKKGLDFLKDPQNLTMFKEQLQGIGTALKDIMDWSASVNENFQQLKQIWRPVQAIADIMMGDGQGAWANTRDFFKYFTDDASAAGQDAGAKLSEGVQQGLAANPPAPPANFNEVFGPVFGEDKVGKVAQPPTIPPPNVEPAKAKMSEYQTFVDQITAQVRGSLQQATSGESLPAPNFESFKAAWSELPVFVTSQITAITNAATSMGTLIGGALSSVTASAAPVWDGLKIQAITAFNQINQAAAALPGQIGSSLGSLQGIGSTAGASLVSGITAGIQGAMPGLLSYVDTIAGQIAEHKGPLPYDRKVLIPNGEALLEGLGVGMENGLKPVLEQAKEMADKISQAFDSGTDPTGIRLPELKRNMDALEEERKRLKVEKNATTDKEAKKSLQAQIDQIQAQKDLLSYQKDRIDNEKDYGTAAGDDPFVKAASGLMKAPVDFAKATGQQFMSDLGISGDGLISRAVSEGISYVFQIGSVDEALSIKDREERKSAMTITGPR
ncbi:tail length tape measure protein [Mycobacterium phage Anthony]|uniref:Tape measure protein n=1 Tax=Mycobacterium phage Anthony TaxID=2599857 RepID=A0A5J6TK83_9CAUD|nr:tail length tape measure protein [Mycobacterium phage Anthony]QFG10397.1 tape measure protein [Mycobacterium phage Anthony]